MNDRKRGNPFSPGFGVVPSPFLGREREARSILNVSVDPATLSHGNASLITAQRGMGKTSLMRHVEDEAAGRGVIVIRSGGNENRILPAMREALAGIRTGNRPRLAGATATVLGSGGGFTLAQPAPEEPETLGGLIARLHERSKGRPILFSIDEVSARSDFLAGFLDEYQLALSGPAAVGLVMNGVPQDVTDMLADRKDGERYTFLNRSNRVHLDVFSRDDSARIVRGALGASGTRIADDALARFVSLAKGHPYLIQLIGARAWDRAGGEEILREDVEAAFSDVHPKYETDVLAPIHDALRRQRGEGASRTQDILTAIARSGSLTNGAIARAIGIAPTSVPPYLDQLGRRELIAKNGDGTYRIRYPYLDDYAVKRSAGPLVSGPGNISEYDEG